MLKAGRMACRNMAKGIAQIAGQIFSHVASRPGFTQRIVPSARSSRSARDCRPADCWQRPLEIGVAESAR